MKVLVSVQHPAHVHFFKHTIQELRNSGHDVRVITRDKEIVVELLQHYGVPHKTLVQPYDGMWDLVKRQVEYEYRVLKEAVRFAPDVMVSVGSPAVGHAAKIVRTPYVMFTDNDVLSNYLAVPFADTICTPENFEKEYGRKHVRYAGYQELAYLHPEQFDPDAELLRRNGIEPHDDFFVLRFIDWGAHHDVGQEGLTPEIKRRLVSMLDQRGEVYITTEAELREEFEQYRLPIPIHAVHHLLYFANLYVGDSQTMATEAALLGTPAIRSNSFVGEGDMENFVELEEKYGLLYSLRDETAVLEKAEELVSREKAQQDWEKRKGRLLDEKENVYKTVTDILLKRGEIASGNDTKSRPSRTRIR